MKPATQALLAEVAAPTHTTPTEIDALLAPVLDVASRYQMQNARYRNLALAVEGDRANTDLGDQAERLHMTLAAADTAASDFIKAARALLASDVNVGRFMTKVTRVAAAPASGPAAPAAT